MTTHQLIKTGRWSALIFFLLGTAIFAFYYISSSFTFLILGYRFIGLAGIINLVILIAIALRIGKAREHRQKLLATIRLMLLNIPVLLLYGWALTILLGTMRISFTNKTPYMLKDINILGCGGGHIDKLETGKSYTVWVRLTSDCSISVDYAMEGERKNEHVVDYITSGMGHKVKHEIGT